MTPASTAARTPLPTPPTTKRYENAALVATELARIFPASGAELMMLAGGARECRGVLEQLPAELRHVTRISRHGGRAPGADTELLTADIEAARLESTALGVEAA
ncbi:baeRF2 domain-containing protein, partial [Streptomyces sp. NPDC003943]